MVVARSVRILHRVERRGDPRVYRMTPFWVMVSKTPILAHDVHEARKLSVHAVKVRTQQPNAVVVVMVAMGPAATAAGAVSTHVYA